jgi:hypothetical protein
VSRLGWGSNLVRRRNNSGVRGSARVCSASPSGASLSPQKPQGARNPRSQSQSQNDLPQGGFPSPHRMPLARINPTLEAVSFRNSPKRVGGVGYMLQNPQGAQRTKAGLPSPQRYVLECGWCYNEHGKYCHWRGNVCGGERRASLPKRR